MPGKRTINTDLEGFDYLDKESDGRYSIRHPVTRRRASLKTRDLAKAKARYNIIMARWQEEQGDHVATYLAEKMGSMSTASQSGKSTPAVAQYAAEWRERWLNVQIGESERGRHGKSKFIQAPCKAISEHTRKPLSDRTALDYARYCHQHFEKEPAWQALLLSARNAAQEARRILSRFQEKPTSYNHHLACLTTMLQQARRDGHINNNWAREIDPLIKPAKTSEEKARNHIHVDDYRKIRNKITEFTYYGQPRDGEWLGRACDLLLFMSSRPADAIGVRDDAFDGNGILTYRASKTGTNIAIEDVAGTLAETVQWFRAWKRRNNVISKHLILYPSYFHKPLAGTPVSARYIAKLFAQAVIDAGYPKGRWELRHLRHTGISMEEEQQGEGANKGAHRSRAGQAPYRTTEPVIQVKNTIKISRQEDSEE